MLRTHPFLPGRCQSSISHSLAVLTMSDRVHLSPARSISRIHYCWIECRTAAPCESELLWADSILFKLYYETEALRQRDHNRNVREFKACTWTQWLINLWMFERSVFTQKASSSLCWRYKCLLWEVCTCLISSLWRDRIFVGDFSNKPEACNISTCFDWISIVEWLQTEVKPASVKLRLWS